jgi:dihydroorotate dehydrogenase
MNNIKNYRRVNNMKFEHKKRSFSGAIGISDEEIKKFMKEAMNTIRMIEKRNEKRSVMLEKVINKMNKYSKKELNMILFFVIEISQDERNFLTGEILGDIISHVMMSADRRGLNIRCPHMENIEEELDEEGEEIEEYFEKMIKDKKKEKDTRVDYVG